MRRGPPVVLLALLAGCPSRSSNDRPPRRPPPARPDAGARPLPPEVVELDARLAAKERDAARRRGDWLTWESVAIDCMTRARLTGDYNDYARAERALARAFENASPGAGPFLTRARFNHTVHRVSRVGADLDALRYAVLRPDERAAIEHLRAEVAFHSGRYDEARRLYTEALARDRDTASLVGMAQLLWKTGDFRGAEALVDEARQRAATEDVAMRAWVCLVRGTMENDRGRWDDALAAFREGLRLQPRSWVFQEHVAEVLMWQGKLEESRLMYEDLVARTGDPEFVNALAEIAERQRKPDDARRFIAQAREGYEARLRILPEATAGHAIEFFLVRDPARAVPIAELNRDARPGGEAQVKLAEAYLGVGRVDDARRTLDAVLATPWNTADLHAVAARVFDRLGDTAAAQREREAARALDPHSVEPDH
ncbi:MAG: tetratricopeptide repeat protein [Polyangiales bacterium]